MINFTLSSSQRCFRLPHTIKLFFCTLNYPSALRTWISLSQRSRIAKLIFLVTAILHTTQASHFVLEKRRSDIHLLLLGRDVEWSIAVFGSSLRWGTVFQQKQSYLQTHLSNKFIFSFLNLFHSTCSKHWRKSITYDRKHRIFVSFLVKFTICSITSVSILCVIRLGSLWVEK